jgi:hypothetical protein
MSKSQFSRFSQKSSKMSFLQKTRNFLQCASEPAENFFKTGDIFGTGFLWVLFNAIFHKRTYGGGPQKRSKKGSKKPVKFGIYP